MVNDLLASFKFSNFCGFHSALMFNDQESFSKEQPVCSLIKSRGQGLLKFPDIIKNGKLRVIPCNHGVDASCFSEFTLTPGA